MNNNSNEEMYLRVIESQRKIIEKLVNEKRANYNKYLLKYLDTSSEHIDLLGKRIQELLDKPVSPHS